MDLFKIEQQVQRAKYNLSREDLERIDNTITYIFNIARKKIEGSQRNIPYSQKKRKEDLQCYFRKLS